MNSFQDLNYEIIDIHGKIVLSGNINGNPIQTDMLSKGVYMIKITGDQTEYTEKIMK